MAIDPASLLQSLVSGAITGTLTAWLSVRLALRKHRAERAWEKRFQAYSDLFSALYDIRMHATRRIAEITEGAVFPGPYLEELSKRAADGFSYVRKAAALGTFTFGAEASELLDGLETALDDPGYNLDPLEEYEERLAVVTRTISSLRGVALRDLDLSLPAPPQRRGDPSVVGASTPQGQLP